MLLLPEARLSRRVGSAREPIDVLPRLVPKTRCGISLPQRISFQPITLSVIKARIA